ncbi:glycosyltransferase [Arenibacter sp. BSSL-BM3]|uniref:Glycosyltransferase n=1 Tax=Arenibacter arenosicollis TaxID=2762274 RepID=A0ABR7QTF9_9FLAO|nr:glycosyltransferase [Arenibacter arenosicollis]MBC8770463.1 glycosyltransferase [Arenibacter arenosicollis]
MNKSLVYISTIQFGYHIDAYKHCQYLKEDFKITFICFDYGYQKIKEIGIEIIYVPWKGSYVSKGIDFMKSCLKLIKSRKVDFIFAVYFPLVSLFKTLSPNKNIILDIRTGSINTSRKNRIITNNLIRFESFFFKKISVISESLALNLKLNMKKVFILPLGSDILSTKSKSFDSLRLFYIGTLDGRNIHQSIFGLKLFLDKFSDNNINVSYDIVGYGTEAVENKLKKAIEDTGLQKLVVFYGRKTHEESKYFFDNCNIGVSHIPITEYYDCQPPTKTFEYINAGMVCIATETQENKKIVNADNGVLCKDSPEGFCKALSEVSKDLVKWDSKIIRKTQSNSTWATISKNLKNYILNSDPKNYSAEKSKNHKTNTF